MGKVGYSGHEAATRTCTHTEEGRIIYRVLCEAGCLRIGLGIIANERRKGYGTEAAQLIVDYLFLTRNVARIQATTHTENVISQRVLEKVGFKKEGTLRKLFLVNGEWTDLLLYSILREEWKKPKILTRTT